MVRKAAVAGQFYPAETDDLRCEVDLFLDSGVRKSHALGILCPHAAYLYSGPTAGKVFSRVELPERIILLGVNHRGIGSPRALFPSGRWQTPLGEVEVDEALCRKIRTEYDDLDEDPDAHEGEHSLEVELPFIQQLRSGTKIVPIIFGPHRMPGLRELGDAIGRVLRTEKEPVLLLSSSDMNHREDHETAERKDRLAIDAIEALDAERLVEVCEEENISMCGIAPTCVMLTAAKMLGAKRGELIHHTTSGEASGDYSSVVGYAGMSIH